MTKIHELLLNELDIWSKGGASKPYSFPLDDNGRLIYFYVIPNKTFAVIHCWNFAKSDEFFNANRPALIYTFNDHTLYDVGAPDEWGITPLWTLHKAYRETFVPLYMRWLKHGEIAKIYAERTNAPIDDYERMGNRSFVTLKRIAKRRLIKEILGVNMWDKKFSEYALYLPYNGECFILPQMTRLVHFASGASPEEMLREEIAAHHYHDQAVELIKKEHEDDLLSFDERSVAKALGFLLSQYPYAVNIAIELEHMNDPKATQTVTLNIEQLIDVLTDGCLDWDKAPMCQRAVFPKDFNTMVVDVSRFISFEHRHKTYEIR